MMVYRFYALLSVVLAAAGHQASALKRAMLLSVLTASLRGLLFAGFIPLFYAVMAAEGFSALCWVLVMTALAIAASVTEWFSLDYDYKGYAARAGDQQRRELGQHLRQIPLQVLYRKRSGETAASVLSNVDDAINYTFTVSRMLIQAVVTPMVVGMVMLFFDWRLGLALLLVFPAVIPIYLWINPYINKLETKQNEANARLSAETIEYTQGLPVLKAACNTQEKFLRLDQAIQDVEDAQVNAVHRLTLPNLLLASMIEIGLLLVVALGLLLLGGDSGKMILLAALMVAIIRFAEPLSIFISLMSIFQKVQVNYEQLRILRDIKPLAQHEPVTIPHAFNIELQNLSFTYESKEEPALQDINLCIPAHALTALVGSSGCGKTTLIRMLMRYADPQKGQVRIGGVDIRCIDAEKLNDLIAAVFQDVYLFDDTVLANIRMGNEKATDDEVIAAARAAKCHEFIEALPEGYHTRVGDIGSHLSGGEKQRISIARALLKDAPIVVLDEPTAALDTFSELAVQKAIDALVKNKTVIVIAHRLSTIVAAKQIVVLDQGKIVEIGKHDELLGKEGRYAELWRAQRSED